MKKVLLSLATAVFSLTASAQYEWNANMLPQTVEEGLALGGNDYWGVGYTLPENYDLINNEFIRVYIEKPTCVTTGKSGDKGYWGCKSGKYPGMKLIMGMEGSTRDGLDASLFDTSVEEWGFNVLETCGCLRKESGQANADEGTPTYDFYRAIITVDVPSWSNDYPSGYGFGEMTLTYSRGQNMSAMYVIDATKQQQVLYSATRITEQNGDEIAANGYNMAGHIAKFGVQPGHRYYIISSEKNDVELYKVTFDLSNNPEAYAKLNNVDAVYDYEWNANMLPQTVEEGLALGGNDYWGVGYTLPENYDLINNEYIRAYIEKPTCVTTGKSGDKGYWGCKSGKYPGMKLIMGMEGSTRDGLDASLFDTSVEEWGFNVLETCGYLRKESGQANADEGTPTYDFYRTIITVEVPSWSNDYPSGYGFGEIELTYSRGQNMSAMYVIDATKQQQALFSATRVTEQNGDEIAANGYNSLAHVARFGVQPGHRYYIISSEKNDVELYRLGFNLSKGNNYGTKGVADGSDAIHGVTATAKNNTCAVYNLAGQKVSSDYRGIAIKNGKKIIVK